MGLSELKYCDAIYLMNGWKRSEGARLEFIYAFTVGIGILEERERKIILS